MCYFVKYYQRLQETGKLGDSPRGREAVSFPVKFVISEYRGKACNIIPRDLLGSQLFYVFTFNNVNAASRGILYSIVKLGAWREMKRNASDHRFA